MAAVGKRSPGGGGSGQVSIRSGETLSPDEDSASMPENGKVGNGKHMCLKVSLDAPSWW